MGRSDPNNAPRITPLLWLIELSNHARNRRKYQGTIAGAADESDVSLHGRGLEDSSAIPSCFARVRIERPRADSALQRTGKQIGQTRRTATRESAICAHRPIQTNEKRGLTQVSPRLLGHSVEREVVYSAEPPMPAAGNAVAPPTPPSPPTPGISWTSMAMLSLPFSHISRPPMPKLYSA